MTCRHSGRGHEPGVGPSVGGGSKTAEGPVHAVGLGPRRRVGQLVAVVEYQSVAGPRRQSLERVRGDSRPPSIGAGRAEPDRRVAGPIPSPTSGPRPPTRVARPGTGTTPRRQVTVADGGNANESPATGRRWHGLLVGLAHDAGSRRKKAQPSGGHRQVQGAGAIAPGDGLGLHPAEVAHAAAAVFVGVAVEQLAPGPALGHARPEARGGAPG